MTPTTTITIVEAGDGFWRGNESTWGLPVNLKGAILGAELKACSASERVPLKTGLKSWIRFNAKLESSISTTQLANIGANVVLRLKQDI